MYPPLLTINSRICGLTVSEAISSAPLMAGSIHSIAYRVRLRISAMFMAASRLRHDRHSEEVLATIMHDYDDMISRICFGYAQSEAEFSDLRQDAIINIWQGLAKYRGDSTLRTWVYRVTLNTCVSTLRKRYKEPNRESLDKLYSVIDESQERRAMITEMHECISQLSTIDKAIMLMWLDEFSYEEIASTMGMPRNTVATRLRRARARLASDTV